MRRRGLGKDDGSGRDGLTDVDVRRNLARFDLFPKVGQDVSVKTSSGGLVSLICALVVVVLVGNELRLFVFGYDFTDRLAVDTLFKERLQVNLNITYHSLGCTQVELIAMDVTGEHQLEMVESIRKHPIVPGRKPGDPCESCFGAADENICCNTCLELMEAYGERGWDQRSIFGTAPQCAKEREAKLSVDALIEKASHIKVNHGCNVEGSLFVNKVAGNFHVALGHGRSLNGRLVHQYSPTQLPLFNTSHTIHSFWFGESKLDRYMDGALENQAKIIDPHSAQTGAFQYFVEIVPTEYRGRRYYQYTKTEQFIPIGEGDHSDEENASKDEKGAMHQGHGHAHPSVISSLPGTFFVYDLSPFVVMRTDRYVSVTEFLTNLLAIVGGTIALSKFIDGFLLSLLCAVK